MGFEEECFRDSVDEMIDEAWDSKNPWLAGISRERLEREPHVRLNFGEAASGCRLPASGSGDELGREAAEICSTQVEKTQAAFLPFAKGSFRTTSGKAELYSEALKEE